MLGLPYPVLQELYTPEQLFEFELDAVRTAPTEALSNSLITLVGDVAVDDSAFRHLLECAYVVWIDSAFMQTITGLLESEQVGHIIGMRCTARRKWSLVYEKAHLKIDLSDCSELEAITKIWRAFER